jgi:hypothetical protein
MRPLIILAAQLKKDGPFGITLLLEPVVHPGETAVGLITGDIQKLAFLVADRTDFRGGGFRNGVSAAAALPGVFRNGFVFRHGFISFLF